MKNRKENKAIGLNRVGMKSVTCDLDANTSFEFWNDHEFEFTLQLPSLKEGSMQEEIQIIMKSMNQSMMNLPKLVSECKRLMEE